MLLGKNEVLEWIELNNTPFWNIRRSANSPVIFHSGKKENLTVAESKEYLEKVMAMVYPGTYFIEASAPDQARNTWYKTSFNLGGTIPANTEGLAGISGQGLEGIKEQVKSELKQEMERDRLRQENIDLKEEIDSWQHRVGNRLEPYIPAIIEGIFEVKKEHVGADQEAAPDQAHVAGIPPDKAEDYQKRLEAAFDEWFKLEKQVHPVELIERIVNLAQTKPDQYKIAKSMLMNG